MRLHPSGGSQYVEWLASGRAPCQVSERASIAAEVKSLKGSDEVMPLSGQKHSSPAKQYPTHDISLARAVLQGEHQEAPLNVHHLPAKMALKASQRIRLYALKLQKVGILHARLEECIGVATMNIGKECRERSRQNSQRLISAE